MKTARLTAFTIALTFLAVAGARTFAQESHWSTDFAKAQTQAKTENKKMLLDFTGSDWCGWCIKMKKDVLDTKEFKDYAAKNFVLVEVDFPNAKHQTKHVVEQNDELKGKYKTEGFPTFVVLEADGKELGRQVGYLEGGPGAFIAKLDSFK
jgi:thioredoxin-related protein